MVAVHRGWNAHTGQAGRHELENSHLSRGVLKRNAIRRQEHETESSIDAHRPDKALEYENTLSGSANVALMSVDIAPLAALHGSNVGR